jgi:hypothetical protein
MGSLMLYSPGRPNPYAEKIAYSLQREQDGFHPSRPVRRTQEASRAVRESSMLVECSLNFRVLAQSH